LISGCCLCSKSSLKIVSGVLRNPLRNVKRRSAKKEREVRGGERYYHNYYTSAARESNSLVPRIGLTATLHISEY